MLYFTLLSGLRATSPLSHSYLGFLQGTPHPDVVEKLGDVESIQKAYAIFIALLIVVVVYFVKREADKNRKLLDYYEKEIDYQRNQKEKAENDAKEANRKFIELQKETADRNVLVTEKTSDKIQGINDRNIKAIEALEKRINEILERNGKRN